MVVMGSTKGSHEVGGTYRMTCGEPPSVVAPMASAALTDTAPTCTVPLLTATRAARSGGERHHAAAVRHGGGAGVQRGGHGCLWCWCVWRGAHGRRAERREPRRRIMQRALRWVLLRGQSGKLVCDCRAGECSEYRLRHSACPPGDVGDSGRARAPCWECRAVTGTPPAAALWQPHIRPEHGRAASTSLTASNAG